MKVNVPNTGARNCVRKTKKASKHGFTIFDMNHLLSVIWLSFQNEIYKDTVLSAAGSMCLMGACDLNFTHSFKKLNKNVCVKTEGNEVVE